MTQLAKSEKVFQSTISATEAKAVHDRLRAGFETGLYRSVPARRKSLQQLRKQLKAREAELLDALAQDLGKPAFEAYTSEIGFCFQEIDHALDHLQEWAQPQAVDVGLALWPTTASSYYIPKGVVLIIAPWNYPLNLTLGPLVAAVAAGCSVLMKPAEDTPATSAVIGELMKAAFDEQHVATVQGPGAEVVPMLMEAARFDHVFYTGSTRVGRILGKQCAEALIPCTLELGGKSPAIVLADAKLNTTIERLVWGKCFNVGQTCVAPDYVLVEESVYTEFLRKLTERLDKAYGSDPQASPDLARIINEQHFDRLTALIAQANVIYGGQFDRSDRFIAPTVVTEVDLDGPLMQEEIFGPILPVIPVADWAEAKQIVNRHPNPLASYLFTTSKKAERRWREELNFGGGCVNDCVIHLGIPALPFGGVQQSGIGRYHGDEGFKTFSNQKSIARTSARINVGTRFAPYKRIYLKAVKWLLG